MNSKRISIQFNLDDPKQKNCTDFLDKCGYKKNQILSLIVEEFLDIYDLNIETLTDDDIRAYLTSYKYLRGYRKKTNSECRQKNSSDDYEIKAAVSQDDLSHNHVKSPKKEFTLPKVPVTSANTAALSKEVFKKTNMGQNQSETPIDMDKADIALSGFGL